MRPLLLVTILALPLVAACAGSATAPVTDAPQAMIGATGAGGYISPYAANAPAANGWAVSPARGARVAPYGSAEDEAALLRAMARNEPGALVQARLRTKPIDTWTTDDIAAMSVMVARDACGLPEGTPLTPTTPCTPR